MRSGQLGASGNATRASRNRFHPRLVRGAYCKTQRTMFFGQKIHPFNFEYGDRAAVRGDAVEISGNSFKARIRCFEITDFCAKLTIENSNVKEPRNFSDGVIESLRGGKNVPPTKGIPT